MHCFAGRNPRSWSTSAGCAAVGSTCSNYIYAVLTAKKRLSTGITRGHVVACELIAMLFFFTAVKSKVYQRERVSRAAAANALVPTPPQGVGSPDSEGGGALRVRPAARGLPWQSHAMTVCVRLLAGVWPW